MNDLSRFWQWLLEEDNRGRLALVGTGVAAAIAAWALFRHSRERENGGTKAADVFFE